MESIYCNREISRLGWSYLLVVTEEQYYEECQRIGVSREDWGSPTGKGSAACTFFHDKKICIVAILHYQTKSGIEVAGLLCHEACHIFQQHCLDIGEHHPSDEFQAYAIQIIAQELMESFWRQVVWPASNEPLST